MNLVVTFPLMSYLKIYQFDKLCSFLWKTLIAVSDVALFQLLSCALTLLSEIWPTFYLFCLWLVQQEENDFEIYVLCLLSKILRFSKYNEIVWFGKILMLKREANYIYLKTKAMNF